MGTRIKTNKKISQYRDMTFLEEKLKILVPFLFLKFIRVNSSN